MDLTYLTSVLALIAIVVISILYLQARQASIETRLEYTRATRDYKSLVDHRLANPLTVISGAAETLLALDAVPLNPMQQTALLKLIRDEAHRIATVSLSPRTQSPEEACLDTVPRSSRVA